MTRNELRQGCFFSDEVAARLLGKSVDLTPNPKGDSFILVVISQDCDLVRDVDAEPYVELILGELIPHEPDGNRIAG